MTSAAAPALLSPGTEVPGTDSTGTRAHPEPAPRVPRLRLLRYEPEVDPQDGPAVTAAPVRGPAPRVPDDLQPTPDLRRRAHQVLWLVLEVLDGRRPLAHLTPHLDPRALRYVRAASGQRPAVRPSRMTSLHVHRPSAGAVEVAAVHRGRGRARALAARFEGRPDEPDRWRCVTLRLL
jgi:hypothetical protein